MPFRQSAHGPAISAASRLPPRVDQLTRAVEQVSTLQSIPFRDKSGRGGKDEVCLQLQRQLQEFQQWSWMRHTIRDDRPTQS